MIKVIAVKALENCKLKLAFNTGETRVFDVAPYLDKGIFTELRDPSYFRSVRLAFGSIAWPHEQDFGPESLYVESAPLSSPPQKVEKAWYYSPKEGKFLAFVNAKGNCSMRSFNAEDGDFLRIQYETGDYQDAFRKEITACRELILSKQPNLEKKCRERLPIPVLTELRRQIPK